MDTTIIKGPISDADYKKAFDDDGIEFRNYNFTLDGKKFNCRVPRLEHLTDGDIMIVEYKKNGNTYEMVSGLHTARNYKWGKVSKLKAYKHEADDLNIVEGKIIEKQMMRKVQSSTGNDLETKSNYNIVIENANFYVPGYIGEKLKRDDLVSAVVSENFAVIVYNKTSNKWYGVKFPYFIFFIAMAVALPIIYYYFQSIGSTLFARAKPGIIIFDILLLFFALPNLSSYRISTAAKRLLSKHLNK